MTTMAYRDGILAADSGVFDRDICVGLAEKIRKNDDGWMGGVTGCIGDSATFLDWLMGGMEGIPAFKDEESEALLISPDGVVEWIGNGQKRIRIEGEYFAAGAGFQIALGAMAYGAGAAHAVRVACEHHVFTRGPIVVLELNEKTPATGEQPGSGSGKYRKDSAS